MAGQELAAQINHDSLLKITGTFYRLSDLNMSDDGKWFTIRKEYNLNRDTILIFNSRYPERQIGYRLKAGTIYFLSNDNMVIISPGQAELFNPRKQSSILFKGVIQIKALRNKTQFLLHYDDEENNKLVLYNGCGELLSTTENVSHFYVTSNDQIYAVTENMDGVSEVVVLTDKTAEVVYKTFRRISYLEPDPGRSGLMIYEYDTESKLQEILYLDSINMVYSLNKLLPISFQEGYREVTDKSGTYFFALYFKKEEIDTSSLDIWYSNDNKLSRKFYPLAREVNYLWEQGAKQVWQFKSDVNTKTACIGSARYFLSFDPYLFQDYTQPARYKINVFDRLNNCFSVMDTISEDIYSSPDGNYVLYKRNKNWIIYCIATGTKNVIADNRLNVPWFTKDSKSVLFEGDGGLWYYELKKGSLITLGNFNGYRLNILNGNLRITLKGFNFFEKTVNSQEPLILKLYDPQENKSKYILWEEGRYKTIIPLTTRLVQSLKYSKSFDCFSWVEEDHNLPPRLVYKKFGEEAIVLYQSNKADSAVILLKQEIIEYQNSEDVPLKGILYYPLNFNPSGSYPLIIRIYEKQRHLSNKYAFPSYYEGLGFNIRLLIENGFFVFLPDILIQGKEDKGPGVDALDCVNNALDAIAGNPNIDLQRIGLIGHSFGGYEADFIATHSNRFAAYVSGCGQSDLLTGYFSFNYNFLTPDYRRIESGQYCMNVPFSENKELYFNNNPIYCAEKVNAPVLLWSGLEDKNVSSDQSMAFYNSLRRNNKDVIALFYKGEGHNIRKNELQFDLTSRIMDWFGFFLKNDVGAEWIIKGVKKGAPQDTLHLYSGKYNGIVHSVPSRR
jgi:dipeptidyl aminopeptidase/acylaminoacyl peptidase